MIDVVTQENAHQYGDAIPGMYRLRYRAFIERQSYNVYSIRNMEYDAYDTPAAVYLLWRSSTGRVSGCTRLSPTDRPYMIKDLWPDLVAEEDLPMVSEVWEASRFCIDKALPPVVRQQIHIELLCAMQEFALEAGIKFMIGVMQPPIWKRIFIKQGWPIDFLGDAKQLHKREQIIAGRMPISEHILHQLRCSHSVPSPVISSPHVNIVQEVA